MVHVYKGKGLNLKKKEKRKTYSHAYFECFKHIKKTPKT
jgi:hypothetical protein